MLSSQSENNPGLNPRLRLLLLESSRCVEHAAMSSGTASRRWWGRLVFGLSAAVAALALTQAVRSGGDSAEAPALAVNEPITVVNAHLLAAGWSPQPEQEPLLFERERAGNNLASLSACSGTGMGFCRYDYRRGHQQLAVVTTPGSTGDGVVHSWFNPD
ncbi:hypothetical protein KUL97_12610 [Synechococcus sp. HK05]|uniref:hypothetical protein n=1 Tax=Synechococcus sp. HK05 TaxID=2725975 RepID=UPI001C38EB5B|nr:hypothetical protein [Synechococcus sp. HK05]MBV2352551.1 hypothetical protein [Synechococcus sp. HK05]